MLIVQDDPMRPEVAALLAAHLKYAAEHSPPGSVHALDLNALKRPEITFWAAWDGSSLLGCAALRELDARHGEVKSMHTAHAHRGKGVAARLLTRIVDEARRRSYTRLSLETGSMAAFAPARALYTRFGFGACGPFDTYREDPNSAFMTRRIDPEC